MMVYMEDIWAEYNAYWLWIRSQINHTFAINLLNISYAIPPTDYLNWYKVFKSLKSWHFFISNNVIFFSVCRIKVLQGIFLFGSDQDHIIKKWLSSFHCLEMPLAKLFYLFHSHIAALSLNEKRVVHPPPVFLFNQLESREGDYILAGFDCST